MLSSTLYYIGGTLATIFSSAPLEYFSCLFYKILNHTVAQHLLAVGIHTDKTSDMNGGIHTDKTSDMNGGIHTDKTSDMNVMVRANLSS